MENLSKEQVLRVAYLSRLELTGKEAETYGRQMTEILNYVSQLSEVDTSGVQPFMSVTDSKNSFREDEIGKEGLEIEDIKKNTPVMDGRLIKIKAVLEGK